jgi:hypothetical protein
MKMTTKKSNSGVASLSLIALFLMTTGFDFMMFKTIEASIFGINPSFLIVICKIVAFIYIYFQVNNSENLAFKQDATDPILRGGAEGPSGINVSQQSQTAIIAQRDFSFNTFPTPNHDLSFINDNILTLPEWYD